MMNEWERKKERLKRDAYYNDRSLNKEEEQYTMLWICPINVLILL